MLFCPVVGYPSLRDPAAVCVSDGRDHITSTGEQLEQQIKCGEDAGVLGASCVHGREG